MQDGILPDGKAKTYNLPPNFARMTGGNLSKEAPMLTVCDHIEVDAKGVARIAGSRIKVSQLVTDAEVNGWGVAELREAFPHLDLAKLHAAFVYYHDHKEEVDRQIAEKEAYVKEMRAKYGRKQPSLAELKARLKS
jgi:uncharacterized protein (DUF433 family)